MGTTDFHLPELLAKNSRHIWIVFDKKLSIKFFNSSLIKISGLNSEDFNNKDLGLIDKLFNEDINDRFRQLINEKVDYQSLGSFRLFRKDINTTFHISLSVQLVFEEEIFKYGILIGEDETPLKFLEQQLNLLSQKWSVSEKLADLGSWALDLVNDNIEWSSGMYDLYQVSKSGKPAKFEEYLQFVHTDDRQLFYDLLESLNKGEKPNPYYDFRIITPSNSIKFIRCVIDVYYEEGKLIKIIGVNQDISDRVSVSEKDKEVSEIFQLAHRFSNMGTWRWSVSTNELFWSDNVYEIFGFYKDVDQPDYNKFLNTIPEEDRQQVANAINECLEHNKTYEVEHPIITKTGEKKWVLEKGNVIRDANGQPIEMYGTVTDISESHDLKSELKFKEERYQLLAESGQEWICLLEPTGQIIYSSPALELLLGYKEKDIINSNFSNFLTSEDKNEFINILKRFIEDSNGQYSLKRKLKSKSGVFIWCEINLKSLIDSKGNFSIRGLIKDISSQVEYEQKLAESNALLTYANNKYKKVNKELQETLEQLEAQTKFLNQINKELSIKNDALNQTAIIVESDVNGNIIFVNDQFLNLAGYKKSEILGKPHCIKYKSIFNSGVHDKEFFDKIWEHLDNKKIWRGEICNYNKNGGRFWLLKTVVPLIDSDGNIESYYSFSSDISLQKQKEKELLISKSATEEAAAAKEEFLSVMSHEIRTPLNSVIGLTNLLQRRNPREDQKDMINTLKKSSDNLMHLVNDILDFNKIQGGNVRLDNIKFELSGILDQLQSSFHEQAVEKEIQLNIVEDFDAPLWLEGDINRLFQILNNVLHNALKFTEKGEVKLTVKIAETKFYKNRIDVEFQLADTGIGIAEDQLKYLFVPFQQSEKHISRKYGGTGLGLSIVKGLVELLGGTIKVESKLNVGTTFYIVIPFLKLEDSKIDDGPQGLNKEENPLDNYRILYVEDVPSNQMLIEELLNDCGAYCFIAADGKEALNVTFKESFDLILMDLQLPKIDGFALTKKIRSQQNGLNIDTPILAFTAEPSSEELYGKIRNTGLQGCVHKPFQFDSLIDKIKTAVKEQPTGKDSAQYNLDYYKKAFKNSHEKLNKIRGLLIQDLSRLLEIILDDNLSKAEIREELHRINPIIKNIECFELLELLQTYKDKMLSNKDRSSVRDQVKMILLNLIESINSNIKKE
ncbi:MAG: PAS domain S-box protein [Bacteroidota bacterium]